MHMRRLAALSFLIAGALFARPKTDVVVMANGDRFTCEIKKLEKGVLYAGFDYVDGTVSIQWSKVARVESSQLFIVHAQDGSIYEGTIRTPETPEKQPVKIEVLELTASRTAVEQTQVVEMAQTSQSFWKRMSGNVDLGAIYTRGNNTTQYNLETDLRVRGETWRMESSLSSNLSSSTGVDASTRNEAKLGARRMIGGKRKWYYAGAGSVIQSSQQGITLQGTASAGVGRFIKDTNLSRASVTAGLAYQSTKYDQVTDTQSPPNSVAAWIGADLHLFKFKKTSLDVTASVLPVLTQAGRIRTYVDSSYSIKLFSDLWWKLSFYGNWDNRPPPTFSGSDYGSSVSLSWTFN